MRKIALAIVDRANWGRMEPLARAIRARQEFDLSLLCCGSTTLKRFGGLADELAEDGYHVASRLMNEIEGSTSLSMARSGGLCQMDAAAELARLSPDLLLLIGDRYQALAVATAAATLHIPIVHIQGGEVSGSLDERYRHAITKLADFHVPATQRAARYLVRMGEHPETILAVGCPGMDIVPARPAVEGRILVVHHPDTNQQSLAGAEMRSVLEGVIAAQQGGLQADVFWPNIDSGADDISKVIRQYREAGDIADTYKNLPPDEYAAMLELCVCAVGNSSSFIRDASRFGTPVVLVGSRQDGRERGANVLRVEPEMDQIAAAIRRQLEHGRYPPDDLYGKQGISATIVEALLTLEPYREKKLSYA